MLVRLTPSVATLVCVLCALCVAPAAFAHDGAPRLEITPERVAPGAPLTVRGVGFAFEEAVTVTLVGPRVLQRLGTFTSDPEGVFTRTLVLPADLVAGTYTLRGGTTSRFVTSPAVVVLEAAAPRGDGEQGRRDEEESLLAPMPSVARAAATGAPDATRAGSVGSGHSISRVWFAAADAGLIGLLVVARGRRARRTRPRS